MAELKYLYSNDDIKYITDELKKGYPVVMPVKNYLRIQNIFALKKL